MHTYRYSRLYVTYGRPGGQQRGNEAGRYRRRAISRVWRGPRKYQLVHRFLLFYSRVGNCPYVSSSHGSSGGNVSRVLRQGRGNGHHRHVFASLYRGVAIRGIVRYVRYRKCSRKG